MPRATWEEGMTGQPLPGLLPLQPASPQENFTKNKPYAQTDLATYHTALSPAQEGEFQQWATQNKVPVDDSQTSDYDMRGFFMGLKNKDSHAQTGMNQNDGRLHFSDYYKTPYHESFSNESRYALANAPKWNEQDQLVDSEGNITFDERNPRRGPYREEQVLDSGVASDAMSVLDAAFRRENIVSSMYDRFTDPTRVGDHAARIPGYNPATDPVVTGRPNDDLMRFFRSGSPMESAAIANRIDTERRAQEVIHRAGGWGTAAVLSAGLLDPVTVLSMALPVAAPVGWGSRAARVGYGVAAQATLDAGEELALHANQETRTAGESVLRVGTGAFVTGAFGALATRVPKAEMEALIKTVDDEISVSARQGSTTGAAEVGFNTSLEDEGIAKGARWLAKSVGQVSPLVRLLQSPIKNSRVLAQKLVDVPFALGKNLKKIPTPTSLESFVRDSKSTRHLNFINDFDNAYKEFQTTGGTLTQRQFGSEVANAMSNKDTHDIPQAMSLASKIRKTFEDDKAALIESGMDPEAFKLVGAESYFPRVYDHEAISANRVDFENRLNKWYTENPKYDKDLVEQLKGDHEKALIKENDAAAINNIQKAEATKAIQDEVPFKQIRIKAEQDTKAALGGVRKASNTVKDAQSFVNRKASRIDRAAQVRERAVERATTEDPKISKLRENAEAAHRQAVNVQEKAAIAHTAAKAPELTARKELDRAIETETDAKATLGAKAADIARAERKKENAINKALAANTPVTKQRVAQAEAKLQQAKAVHSEAFNAHQATKKSKLSVEDAYHTARDHRKALAQPLREAQRSVREAAQIVRNNVTEVGTDLSKFRAAQADKRLQKAMKEHEAAVAAHEAAKSEHLKIKDLHTESKAMLDEAKRSHRGAEAARDKAVKTAEKATADLHETIGMRKKILEDYTKASTPRYLETYEVKEEVEKTINKILGTRRGMADLNHVANPSPLKMRSLDAPDKVLEPYLSKDLEHVMNGYNRAMVPQIESRKMFPDSGVQGEIDRVANMYGVKQEELSQRAVGKSEAEVAKINAAKEKLRVAHTKDEKYLNALRARVMGEIGAKGDESLAWVRAQRIIRAYNYTRLLGSQTASSLSDYGHLVMRYGLVRTLGHTANFLANMAANKLSREDAKRMGTAIEWVVDTRSTALADIGDIAGNSKIDRAAQYATQKFSRWTGMATWNSSLKAISSILEQDALFRTMSKPKLSAYEMSKFAQNGIGEEEMKMIREQWAKYGTDEKGLHRARTELWDRPEVASMLERAITKNADTVVITRGHGDLPLFMDKEHMKTLTQFRSFGVAAVNRLMIPTAQGLAHGDVATANGLMMMLFLGSATYTLKELAAGRKPNLAPSRLAAESLNWSGVLGFLPDLYDPAAAMAHAPRFSRYEDRAPLESFLGPTFGTATDLVGTLTGLTKAPAAGVYDALGAERPQSLKNYQGLTDKDIHRLRKLAPWQNHILFRRGINAIEGEVSEALGADGSDHATFMDRVTRTEVPQK